MALGFEGKHVVVTGGNGALGSAVVDAFLAAGATCSIPQRATQSGSPRNARVEIVSGIDLTDESAVQAYFARQRPLWASVHVAGGFAAGGILETSAADLRRQLDTNLMTAFLACREAVRNMRRHGGGGRLVHIVSRAALVPAGGMVAYSVAKAAVAMLTRSLAEELKSDGILVNAVAPSTIDTPANRSAMPDADSTAWPKPEEIARTIVWLASPDNVVTSGAIVPVFGRT